ncbi:zinc-dependent peptidase [Cyclobacteriaceae bacterium]|nr:zinc-dependent peptidase [Cyclobacteriaceae bacterium]
MSFFSFFLFLVLAGSLYAVINAVKDSGANIKKTPKYIRPLSINVDAELTRNFPFYKYLSAVEKKHFVIRVKMFVTEKEFIGRKMVINDRQKVLIAATAIQLTFGFPPIILKHFKKIILYPDKYTSTTTNLEHYGEVNTRGIIVLSWRYFERSLKTETDGKNLGLHEMAHALKLENTIKNGEYGFISKWLLGNLYQTSLREMNKIRSGQNTFLRKYAAANEEEFFAVSVEYFFEKPIEFQAKVPELFILLTQILRQNPAVRSQKK